jgi:hypothetical protein
MNANPFNHTQLHHTIFRFEQRTRWLWRIFPVIKLTMVTVLTKPWSIDLFRKTLKGIPITLNSIPFETAYCHPAQAEVIIAYSSEKPSWYPALKDLAVRLTQSGINSYLIQRGKFSPVLYAEHQGIENVNRIGLVEKVNALVKSLFCCLLVSLILMTSSQTLHILLKTPLMFSEMIRSYLRIGHIRKVLRRVQPKIVITNGEHLPICSELMFCAKETGSYTIWFYNEWPQSGFIPYLANEAWTWNFVSKNAIQRVIANPTKPMLVITGHAESDYNDHIYHDSNIDEDLEWINSSGRPLLIFLLDYNGKGEKSAAAAGKALEIIHEVALSCSQWSFLIKPKVFQFKGHLPGEDLFSNLDNCRVLHKKSSLGPFLKNKQTRVIVSCQSSGLIAAAGHEKTALRLVIPGVDEPLEYIDSLSLKVKSSNEIEFILKHVDDYSRPSYDSEKLFPYKGKVVDNMALRVRMLMAAIH